MKVATVCSAADNGKLGKNSEKKIQTRLIIFPSKEPPMLAKLQTVYGEFPTTFWTLMGASFIDRLGGALLFPFLHYISRNISGSA